MKIMRQGKAIFFANQTGDTVLGFHPDVYMAMFSYSIDKQEADIEVNEKRVAEKFVASKSKISAANNLLEITFSTRREKNNENRERS